ITIGSQLSFKQYLNANFAIGIKKLPVVLFIIIVAVSIIWELSDNTTTGNAVTSVADLLSYIIPVLVMLLIFPLSIYSRAKRHYASNKAVKEKKTFTFSESGMSFKSDSVSSSVDWAVIYKIDEMKNYVIIYASKFIAHMIPKSCFSAEQLIQFRAMVRAVPGLKVRLKNE